MTLPGEIQIPVAEAKQLLALVEAIGLEDAIKAEHFRRFKEDERNWPGIRQEISLLDSALNALKRMAS